MNRRFNIYDWSYQTARNPKSMYIFIILQLFTFDPELFVLATQTIVNKNWTTYQLQSQQSQFFFNLTYFVGTFSF